MSENISVIVRSADQTRKAEVALPLNIGVEQLLREIQSRWNLPSNSNYALRLERTGQQLDANGTLDSTGVKRGDILEVYPILEAG